MHLARRFVLLLADANNGGSIADHLVLDTHGDPLLIVVSTLVLEPVEYCHFEKGISCLAFHFLEVGLGEFQLNFLPCLRVLRSLEPKLDIV